ncbi:hypothetical protein PVAND_011918 [Polypedilum vanderplanki]|uniref:Uncharacterized protein n=1 Tax=Polypedilum vanderplanki TaxID=319348 RepID=A0A9J6CKU5_POLVA|nr:hypothetical protein PVAND_011918 [Polypedilum vanderplanki]
MKLPAFLYILFSHYHIYYVSGKGLTMIKRGCIANDLQHNQLLNSSFSIGPVAREVVCNNILKSIRQNVIDDAVTAQVKNYEYLNNDDDIKIYKECLQELIERNNLTNFLIKSFMYREEEIENHIRFKNIEIEIMKTFDYLCFKNKFDDDFNQKFPNLFTRFENETNQICLINLLRQKEIIEEDFEIEFDMSDVANIECPEINEEILKDETDANKLIYQKEIVNDEEIRNCAINERTKIGYITSYYRFLAYSMSHDDRKNEERKKFLIILRQANENAIKCFISGYEYL